MNLTELKAAIESKVLGTVEPGTMGSPRTAMADSFELNWLSFINEPGKVYKLFLMLPPKLVNDKPRDKSWRNYELTCYLFDKDELSGNRLKPAERDDLWTVLVAAMDVFIDRINEDTQRMHIVGDTRYELDEGHVGNADLVWLKLSMTLKVANC